MHGDTSQIALWESRRAFGARLTSQKRCPSSNRRIPISYSRELLPIGLDQTTTALARFFWYSSTTLHPESSAIGMMTLTPEVLMFTVCAS